MATLLTKALRAGIVKSVIGATDIPQRRADILQLTRVKARDALIGALPPEFIALVKQTTHHEWFHSCSSLWVHSPENHPRGVLNGGNYLELEAAPVPTDFSLYGETLTHVLDALEPLLEQARELRQKDQELRESLMAYLLSCRTCEAALKGMPELADHVPRTVSKTGTALVAPSNVLSALLNAGFKPKEVAAAP